MFRGRYEHTIDLKGRLSVPSRFRDVLSEKYDSRLVATSYDGCLLVYPLAEWLTLETKVAELPSFNKDTKAFLRFFYSGAVDCPIDKLGRILVPQELRSYAKLEKDVILVGAFKRIEIWSKAEWERVEGEASKENLVATLERLGL